VGVPALTNAGISPIPVISVSQSKPPPRVVSQDVSVLADHIVSALSMSGATVAASSADRVPVLESPSSLAALRQELSSANARIAALESQKKSLVASLKSQQKQSSSRVAALSSVVRKLSRTSEKQARKFAHL